MTGREGILGTYELKQAFKKSARRLGERGGLPAVQLLARRYEETIGSPEEDRYCYIWRSAVEEHDQDEHHDDFRSVLVTTIRDASLAVTKNTTEDGAATASYLLKSQYPMLVRVGLFLCAEHYGILGDTFWKCFNRRWLYELSYWHEFFWLVKKNFARFNPEERRKFIASVVELKGDWQGDKKKDEWDEKQRRDVLHPAVGLGDAEVDRLYSELVARHGAVREYPDFHSYSSGAESIGEKSHVTVDQVVAMSDTEFEVCMRDFVPESNAWNGTTYRGFAETIAAAVRSSDDGFSSRISLFLDAKRPYQHGLLSGLKDRWAIDKNSVDWIAVLALIKKIVSTKSFQLDLLASHEENWEPTIFWVVTDIADLLKVTAAGDSLPIGPAILRGSFELLVKIVALVPGRSFHPQNDAVSHAINSHKGRVIEALIHVSLAIRKIENGRTSNARSVWRKLEPVLNNELLSAEIGENVEFSALAVIYCVNLHYLNSKWVEENFNRIFTIENTTSWRSAAQGFAYVNHHYKWLYERLSTGGHIRRMIFDSELPDAVARKALQFLGLAYLEEQEDLLPGGLLHELVSEFREKELSQLCWFFWTMRGTQKKSPKYVLRILDFWKKISFSIRASGGEHEAIQSALNPLAAYIDGLPADIEEIWTEAAPYAQVGHHGYILMEHLARLASSYPDQVTRIFKSALTGFLPDYRAEDVIRCVLSIADAGHNEDAQYICNAYAERGSTLLSETYQDLLKRELGDPDP